MPTYNRGGKTHKAMFIGHLDCLRQHLLLPGERLIPSVRGNVRLSGLRQQTSVYLHAQLEAFAAPLRWYYANFPTYLKEGVSTAETIPTVDTTAEPIWLNRNVHSALGIGNVNADFAEWHIKFPASVHNEWFRWPEDARQNLASIPTSYYSFGGPKTVNLSSAATRIHDAPSFDATTETDVPSATVLDVRDLARFQARFNQAAVTDWTSVDRYNVFMRDIFGAKGNNEVDQVPIRLRSGAELSVHPRDLYASDASGLGEIMSINNFQVDHQWDPFVAPEHMIVGYFMTLRFSPILEDNVLPGVYPQHTDYFVYQGDPDVIAAERPVDVAAREIDGDGDATVLGYLPAGWQLREGFSHIDDAVATVSNFPLLDSQPLTAAGYRDATRINNCFRSTQLNHCFADLDFNCAVMSGVPAAGRSIVAGAGVQRRGPGGIHPVGGYLE